MFYRDGQYQNAAPRGFKRAKKPPPLPPIFGANRRGASVKYATLINYTIYGIEGDDILYGEDGDDNLNGEE
ncbi:MAG: hypothetical protein HUK22_02975, partial [Thermoguttaceae bacterium]|nr:hypothetical protein [Thermoguttaceae bacterium]